MGAPMLVRIVIFMSLFGFGVVCQCAIVILPFIHPSIHPGVHVLLLPTSLPLLYVDDYDKNQNSKKKHGQHM